jgi:hypothetical protein
VDRAQYDLGVNVLAVLGRNLVKISQTVGNKWRCLWCSTRDAELIRAHAECRAAEAAMAAIADEAEAGAILDRRWAPAYRSVSVLPATTWRGLAIKLAAAIEDLQNGATEHTPDLVRTARQALQVLDAGALLGPGDEKV